MLQISRHYINGFLNADDEPNSIGAGECINALNMRFGSTDGGKTGRWESSGALQAITNPLLPAGTCLCLGSAANEADRYLITFIHNSEGNHGIYLYYAPTGGWYTVLADPLLNFQRTSLVRALVLNDTLYFTDNYNPPRCIHLGAAIAHYSGASPIPAPYALETGLSAADILLIRKPFPLPPSIRKEQDPNYALNRIATESFQFAVQYIYWTGEKTVLSPWSKASRLNAEGENYNFIQVALPVSEAIPQEVRFVRLVALFGSSKKAFVVKTWDKAVTADREAIQNHNSGSSQLTFLFFNTNTGEALSEAEITTPYHSIPIQAKAMEAARNRLFLGNNLEGYNTPSVTSLEVDTPETGERDNVYVIYVVHGRYREMDGSKNYATAGYAIFATLNGRTGYYFLESTRYTNTVFGPEPLADDATLSLSSPPATVAAGDLSEMGTDSALTWFLKPTASSVPTQPATTTATTDSVTLTGLDDEDNSALAYFKGGGVYQYGIVFYDEALRKCGVVTSDSLKVSVRERDYEFSYATPSMRWRLSNTNALLQIPDWARYYAIVRTLNLKTRFFLQSLNAFLHTPRYATRNNDGTYSYESVEYVDSVAALALNRALLGTTGLGYTYQEGDVAVLYLSGRSAGIELPVMGTDGNFILVKPHDIGNLSGIKLVYEIYIPYTPSENEPFYEIGEMHPIAYPGTSMRSYSILSGTLPGDIAVVKRKYKKIFIYSEEFLAEAMCPNDKYWQRWDTDAGRINLVTTLGQYRDKTGLRYSGTFVYGTGQNGLSAFEALNQEDLPVELGAVQSLTLAGRLQAEGTVMLAIGSAETVSIHLGETQVTNSDGSTYFIKDEGVVSTVYPLQGSYGTLHPESVIAYKGGVWWFDALSAAFVQYSAGGLNPISNAKLTRVAGLLARHLLQSPSERPFVLGGADPYHDELLWTIPGFGTDERSLSDYDPPRPYPYDVWDKGAKTLVYKLRAGRWQGAFSETPEGWVALGSDLYSFQGGALRQHNQPGDVVSRLAFVCNTDGLVKIFQMLRLEASHPPDWVHCQSEDPYTAASELVAAEFSSIEGVWSAPIQRDRFSPNAAGDFDDRQLSGDPLRSKALLVVLEWRSSAWFRLATIGYNISSGHY